MRLGGRVVGNVMSGLMVGYDGGPISGLIAGLSSVGMPSSMFRAVVMVGLGSLLWVQLPTRRRRPG